jgi:hypothetical protein
MRITLTRHGGQLAGMRLPPSVIDTATLDPVRAERLKALVARALASRSGGSSSRGMPDARSYSITIDDEGSSTTLKEGESMASSPFTELLEFLEQLG